VLHLIKSISNFEEKFRVIKSDTKLKELVLALNGKNSMMALQAVKKVRNEEPFEGAIAQLATAFNRWDDKPLKRAIEDFFNDIKDLSVRPEIIAEIRKPYNPATIGMLVASCWQSGLDYSDFTGEIVNTFLAGDYYTSIECMTVISESAANCSREIKDEFIEVIRNSPGVWTNEKKSLTLELISILEA
jgi:hypothetical protein